MSKKFWYSETVYGEAPAGDDYDLLQNDYDLEELTREYDLADLPTLALVKVGDGEYTEVYTYYGGLKESGEGSTWYQVRTHIRSNYARTNEGVARSWRAGFAQSSSNGNFHTDGFYLWSYQMIIGRTENGVKELLDVSGLYAYSVTTSSHVREAQAALRGIINKRIVTPKVTRKGYGSWRVFPTEDWGSGFHIIAHDTGKHLADFSTLKEAQKSFKNVAANDHYALYDIVDQAGNIATNWGK